MQHEHMLALCREIENISIKMKSVVVEGRWEDLVEMDAQVSDRIDTLKSAGGFGIGLSAKEQKESADLITRILDIQQNIRQAIQEKVTELTSMLTANSVEQKLSHAYSSAFTE